MLWRMSWPLFTVEALTAGLETRRVGRRVHVLAETVSTNDDALAAAEREGAAADGLAIFAEYQTAGRGRQGRAWLAPRGSSILCSVVLIGADEMSLAGELTLVAGIAACDAVRETTTLWPVLRWPNDVYFGERKLAGILVESRPVARGQRAWAIGVGINCYQHSRHFPPEIRDRATSLERAAADPPDRLGVARSLLRQLDTRLGGARPDPAGVRQAWLERAEPLGKRIAIASEGRTYTGHTVDVDPQEGLLVQLDEGARRWFDASKSQVV